MVPTHWDDRLVVSLGDTIKHEHEEEGGEMESNHNHSEEAEEALWDKNILSARYQAIFWPRDTCQFIYGASYLKGENFMGENAQLYGLDFTYTWREDKPKGKQFTWRNDAMLRKVSTEEGSFEETAFSSAALYRFKPEWEMGLRYNYLEGVKDPELPERHRVSPSLSHYFLLVKSPPWHDFNIITIIVTNEVMITASGFNLDSSGDLGVTHTFINANNQLQVMGSSPS